MHKSEQGYTDKTLKEDLELPLFDLTAIADYMCICMNMVFQNLGFSIEESC